MELGPAAGRAGMKRVRFGDKGRERPAMVGSAGRIRDLSRQAQDTATRAPSRAGLARLRARGPDPLPLVPEGVRLGACVGGVGKVVCIGRTYQEHAGETGNEAPSEPVIFMKATSAINGPFDDVPKPARAQKMDWEVEL